MDCRTQLASLTIEELDKGDYMTATKMLNTRIRLEPNNHELYYERSICHYKLGESQASLDDANAAIRLGSTDFNVFYQKGLALLGLNMLSEAVASFKKAIELRAKQEDSKLSDIFKLLRDASNELNTARRKSNYLNANQQARSDSVPMQPINQTNATAVRTGSDPVDSTTDRPLHPQQQHIQHQQIQQQHQGTSSHQNSTSMGGLVEDGANPNLVATSNPRNSQPISIQIINGSIGSINRVSSSASHAGVHQGNACNNNNTCSDMPGTNKNLNGQHNLIVPPGGSPNIDHDSKAAFEWNIRRSERIFLHHTNEPGTSSPQYGIITRHPNDTSLGSSSSHPQHRQQKATNSNPSSINSGMKRPHDAIELQTYQTANLSARQSKEGSGSHAESDVDVDDSHNISNLSETSALNNHQKRLVITPSSSMPASNPGQPPTSTTPKDDSYSSRYKRLRRDRERARRGTSKLCTIKPSDLDELLKTSASESAKRFMRVIAPIDGWLYSGQLSVESRSSEGNSGPPQYVVKLDGDVTGSSYLFSQETVLNDVIKEVRVKSVSELRKGARICCYWSRQYKCLSTGVVTSRTFEATKSLVSVKYDNGDLSALPLEDLRLLPPDYPKYMSNCDPLLLARNSDGAHATATTTTTTATTTTANTATTALPNGSNQSQTNGNHQFAIDSQNSIADSPRQNSSVSLSNEEAEASDRTVLYSPEKPMITELDGNEHAVIFNKDVGQMAENDADVEDEDEDEDATIPPTNETINFITSENNLNQHEEKHCAVGDLVERVPAIIKDNITLNTENQMNLNSNNNNNNSRASSEENNYGFEYRPWVFDGEPRRNKRNGRTYRDYYNAIRRGNEIIQVGDSAELMPRDESILPFIAKIDGLWATSRGEMRVRVRWYYRLIETEGLPYDLRDGENALFETDHFDENDVQSIYRSTKILSWTDYCRHNMGHVNNTNDNAPKIFYLAGSYDPVRRVKHLRSDVKEA